MPRYKRALVKLSGEALMGSRQFGIDPETLNDVARQITQAHDEGATVAETGMDRATADYAGMLGTIMNALALQDALEKAGATVRTQTALPISQVAEPYIRRRAIRHLEKGRVVIFAAGTGNPFMTTDTAGALRVIETDCEILLMAKNGVDGVYDADPAKVPTAKKYDQLTHIEAIQQRLAVMDITALSMCMEHHLPILVFDVAAPDAVFHALRGDRIGTIVTASPEASAAGGS